MQPEKLFYKVKDNEHYMSITFSRAGKCALLEAVIGVKCPLAPAGGGLGIEPVGREHHEDEVGVERLLLFFQTVMIVKVRFHTCRSESVSLEDTERNCTKIQRIC